MTDFNQPVQMRTCSVGSRTTFLPLDGRQRFCLECFDARVEPISNLVRNSMSWRICVQEKTFELHEKANDFHHSVKVNNSNIST